MKRGFLNAKKVKDKPLYENAESTAKPLVAALKPLQPSSAACQPGVDCWVTNAPRSLEPHKVVRIPSSAKGPSSACILRPSTHSKILKTKGHYTPLPAQNPVKAVFTIRTSDMGLGFAKCGIKVQEVIFSERPLLVFPNGIPVLGIPGLSKEEALRISDAAMEENLQQALSKMPKEDVDEYMSLTNCFPDIPQLFGIARTNAFSTEFDSEEETDVAQGDVGYAAVGKLVSRINHCCMPNVDVEFDIPTFSLQIRALRNIRAGDQLFYSYCPLDLPVKERRKQLERYGFLCKCRACVKEWKKYGGE